MKRILSSNVFINNWQKAGLECMHFLKYYRKCWSWLLFKFTNTTSVFDSALQLKLAGSFWLDFPECFLAMSKNNVLFLSLLQHASSINYNFSIFWSSCLSYAVNFWMFSLVLSLVCLSHTVDGIKLSNTHLIWFTYIWVNKIILYLKIIRPCGPAHKRRVGPCALQMDAH